MKLLYPTTKLNVLITSTVIKAGVAILLLIAAFSSVANAQDSQELVFKNAVLQSGLAGADNAVYRFSSVMAGTDALVKINGRSSAMVQLVTIDLTNTGFEKAFQPQVTYGNNTSPSGKTDWWMEFQVSFVQSGTSISVNLSAFDVSGLDIDGNNDKISEYASFYGLQSFALENNSTLKVTAVKQKDDDAESGNGNGSGKDKNTVIGNRYDGPVTNFTNVDTLATTVMVTNKYVATNTFRLRTGAKSTGVSGAADRMYSFWFKTFAYDNAKVGFLPVTMINWSALYTNNNIALKWTTTSEKNASHFIIERSFDGAEYSDVAMLFAVGNSDVSNNYSYNDKVPAGNSGIIYYRLKMADMDGRYKTSEIRIVRIGKSADNVKILAYPNPVVNDVRVTIPQSWQGKTISYQLTNANGQVIKSYTVKYAGQTEVISMSQVPTGMYVMRVINGNETAVQSVVKSNK